MARGIRRSFVTALVVVAAGGAAKLLWIEELCPWRAESVRAHGLAGTVAGGGSMVARPGDAIFLCDVPHVTGPIAWHTDRRCECAPAELPAAAVSLRVGGSCVPAVIHPAVSDASGVCRHAQCDEHIDP